MSNTEKNKKKQERRQVRLATATFLEEVTSSSTFTDLHTDFQDFFEVLMRSDEADDPEFRDRALLMLQFTRSFSSAFAPVEWNAVAKEAQRMKDKVSLKMLPTDEL